MPDKLNWPKHWKRNFLLGTSDNVFKHGSFHCWLASATAIYHRKKTNNIYCWLPVSFKKNSQVRFEYFSLFWPKLSQKGPWISGRVTAIGMPENNSCRSRNMSAKSPCIFEDIYWWAMYPKSNLATPPPLSRLRTHYCHWLDDIMVISTSICRSFGLEWWTSICPAKLTIIGGICYGVSLVWLPQAAGTQNTIWRDIWLCRYHDNVSQLNAGKISVLMLIPIQKKMINNMVNSLP